MSDAVLLEWFKDWARLQPTSRVLDMGQPAGRVRLALDGYLTTGSCERFDLDGPRGARLPFDDASFDLVAMVSELTHLPPDDLEARIAEAGRVLKPGGHFFCSAYLMSEEARAAIAAGSSRRMFKRASDRHWQETLGHSVVAVAYSQEYFADVLAKAGLVPSLVFNDRWWEVGFAEDIFVARKPDPAAERTVDFTCNVCGQRNASVALERVSHRELPSCAWCQSTLRQRALVHALSTVLHGSPRSIPEFPEDKGVRGLGMSDWEGLARRLAAKLGYINTYFHTEPRLDITDVPEEWVGRYRFLLSGDVFEHIPPAGLDRAFRNSRRLLMPGGAFVFTVPFTKDGETREHFPRLHDFRIVEEGGRRVLRNVTADGEHEVFDNLVFHGGDGMTLEMRLFSGPDLVRRLKEAGFSDVRIHTQNAPESGIIWPMDWAVPIVARA